MRLVPFQIEHLWALEAVDERHNRDGRDLLRAASPEVLEELTKRSWSIEHEGRIVVCGGRAVTAWWILCEPAALARPVTLTRLVRATLRAQAKAGDIAHALDAEAGRWLEVLGFVRSSEQDDPGLTRYEWPA